MNVYPGAYVRFLVYFHVDRDYFECHEVLEEYWKEHPEDVHAESYVVLIQIAVASYHQRRGNLKGALKMFSSALQRLKSLDFSKLGIDGGKLAEQLRERVTELERAERVIPAYSDLQLPIIDPKLRTLCDEACTNPSLWGRPSDLTDAYLLHKHTLRDRSAVVRERERQKRQRRNVEPSDENFSGHD